MNEPTQATPSQLLGPVPAQFGFFRSSRNEEGAGQRNFKPPEGAELKRGGEGGESESEGSPEPL